MQGFVKVSHVKSHKVKRSKIDEVKAIKWGYMTTPDF